MSAAKVGPVAVEVGKRLRALRKARRWSIEKAAFELGMTPPRLGTYERAERAMTLDTLVRMCATYGVNVGPGDLVPLDGDRAKSVTVAMARALRDEAARIEREAGIA